MALCRMISCTVCHLLHREPCIIVLGAQLLQAQSCRHVQDIDCSGGINFEEFVAGVLEDGDLLTSSKLHVAFDFLDRDKDGRVDLGAPLALLPRLCCSIRTECV